jgi:hypothetical protein
VVVGAMVTTALAILVLIPTFATFDQVRFATSRPK